MMPKHAFNITLSRFNLVYKQILYTLVVGLVLSAIAVGLLLPMLSPVFGKINDANFFGLLGKAIGSLFNGDLEAQSAAFLEFRVAYDTLLDIFQTDAGVFFGAFGVILVVFYVFKYFLNVYSFTAADITNNFMNSATTYGVTSNIIANLKVSARYSLLMTLFDLLVMAVNLGIVILFGYVLSRISVLLMLPIVLIVIIVLCAIKNSIFAYWLPILVVDRKNVLPAFREAMKMAFVKKNFFTNLGAYCGYWFLILSTIVIFSLLTFGVALLVIPAICLVFSKAYNLVSYYNINALRYYTDKGTVINSDINIGKQK